MGHWRPKTLVKQLTVQAAFDTEHLHLRFEWDQPDPGGWLHDMLVYRDGRWHRYASPSPWVSDRSNDHQGFYEDRISFLLDDGSVHGGDAFGGWLTVHRGMRSLPDEIGSDEIEAHPHYGRDGLGRTDIRKYLPHACAGEWWENDWREVRPPAELEQLKRDGVFFDLPMWRAHRSDPLCFGTDHHILDYRHTDAGRHTYTSQVWDPIEGPTYMFDPSVVPDGALDHHAIANGAIPPHGADGYALDPEHTVAFDPAVAEWEGAMIPRRPLQSPTGSAADWRASGTWRDGRWVVEMSRRLTTEYPLDTTQLQPGEYYTISPAVHHGAGTRWHWVAYPYRLGLGIEPPPLSSIHDADRTSIVATPFEGGTPPWESVDPVEIPLLFPGLVTWDDLISDTHPQSAAVRAAEITMWELYEKDPASFLEDQP